MSTMIPTFQQLRPCIAPGEHKFAANLIRVVVCERCGMTPEEARS